MGHLFWDAGLMLLIWLNVSVNMERTITNLAKACNVCRLEEIFVLVDIYIWCICEVCDIDD